MKFRYAVVTLAIVAGLVPLSRAHGSLYSDTVLASNPTAYYRMSESSGTTMFDSVNANNGTYGSAITLNAAGPQPPTFPAMDPGNTGIFSDGTANGFGAIPTVAGLNTTTYSMELWFNYSGSKLQYLLGRGSGTSLQYDTIGLNGTNLLYFNGATVLNGPAVTQNAWHQLIFTRSGTAINIYLDSVNVISNNVAATYGASTRIVVGDRPSDVGGLNPVAFYDELSLYNSALTAAQVLNHFAPVAPVPEPSTLALLSLGMVSLAIKARRRRVTA